MLTAVLAEARAVCESTPLDAKLAKVLRSEAAELARDIGLD